MKGSPHCIRVEGGKLRGINEGYEDWDGEGEPWGYMHEHCFYMAVGDPRAVEAMAEASP